MVTQLDTLTLGNQIFDDVNGDGKFDAGDTGVANVNLTLFADTNNDGVFDAGDTQIAITTTNGSGIYSFAGLAAGNYIVEVDANNFAAGGALVNLASSDGDPRHHAQRQHRQRQQRFGGGRRDRRHQSDRVVRIAPRPMAATPTIRSISASFRDRRLLAPASPTSSTRTALPSRSTTA